MVIWNLNKAVAEFRQRGVQIKMITGDARETALAISNQLGLLAEKALSGKEIDELGELELPSAVSESSGKMFENDFSYFYAYFFLCRVLFPATPGNLG